MKSSQAQGQAAQVARADAENLPTLVTQLREEASNFSVIGDR